MSDHHYPHARANQVEIAQAETVQLEMAGMCGDGMWVCTS